MNLSDLIEIDGYDVDTKTFNLIRLATGTNSPTWHDLFALGPTRFSKVRGVGRKTVNRLIYGPFSGVNWTDRDWRYWKEKPKRARDQSRVLMPNGLGRHL